MRREHAERTREMVEEMREAVRLVFREAGYPLLEATLDRVLPLPPLAEAPLCSVCKIEPTAPGQPWCDGCLAETGRTRYQIGGTL